MSAQAQHDPAAAKHEQAGGWAPLRYPDFRRLWLAQFTSNVGSWMQTVAAQWVMTSLTSSALLLSAIQAAGSIPVLLLAVPAGALGDLVDRKRLIFCGQLLMLTAAAVLAVLSAVGGLTPLVLIVLLFVIGVGGALGAPTWQTLQPELVTGEVRSQAIALGSVNQNLARAVGPAIGGLLLAATSAALVFGVNAGSFVAVLGAVMITRIPVRERTLPREHAFASGAAWITGLGTLSNAYQGQLPAWAKARAFAYYLVAFQGAMGVGSLAIGAVAQATSVRTALLVVAGGLLVCLVVTSRLPLPAHSGGDEHLSEPLPLPQMPDASGHGPLAVTVEYALQPSQVDAFLALAGDLRRLRRRTGAVHWHLHRDITDPSLFTELFIIGSWEEHEHQHARIERADQQLLAQVDALLQPGHPRIARHARSVSV